MATESIADQGNKEGKGKAISTPLAQRIRRGIEHYHEHGERIEWVQEDRCRVPSCRHPERFYLVIFDEDGERCNCPDFSRSDLGSCKHTFAALCSRTHKVEYRVAKRHDSRIGGDIYEVIESRAGVDRIEGWSRYAGTAYEMMWVLENIDAGEAA